MSHLKKGVEEFHSVLFNELLGFNDVFQTAAIENLAYDAGMEIKEKLLNQIFVLAPRLALDVFKIIAQSECADDWISNEIILGCLQRFSFRFSSEEEFEIEDILHKKRTLYSLSVFEVKETEITPSRKSIIDQYAECKHSDWTEIAKQPLSAEIVAGAYLYAPNSISKEIFKRYEGDLPLDYQWYIAKSNSYEIIFFAEYQKNLTEDIQIYLARTQKNLVRKNLARFQTYLSEEVQEIIIGMGGELALRNLAHYRNGLSEKIILTLFEIGSEHVKRYLAMYQENLSDDIWSALFETAGAKTKKKLVNNRRLRWRKEPFHVDELLISHGVPQQEVLFFYHDGGEIVYRNYN